MAKRIPERTITAFARSIMQAARDYGFDRIDTVRLINALMDASIEESAVTSVTPVPPAAERITSIDHPQLRVERFPLRSPNLTIRLVDLEADLPLMESWLHDKYGQHFIISCSTAQRSDLRSLLSGERNHVGMILLNDRPIGAVAFLDLDRAQRRAELRKLIGDPEARGKGYAEEATVLWLKYGIEQLSLEKIYVSTLQNHLRNIQLNESIGFRIEGVLADEIMIQGERMDVLRMGLSRRRPATR